MAWFRRQPIPEAWLLLVAGLCILAFVVADVAWVGGRPARAEAGVASASNTDPTLTGELHLQHQGFFLSRSAVGDPCKGLGPNSDLLGGTPVVVKDQAGTVVATGALDIGRVAAGSACEFNLVVGEIPKADAYEFDIGGRTAGRYRYDDLVARGWQVELTLG